MRESDLNDKYLKLIDDLKQYVSMVIAFSGGVDSSLLLAAAYEALGDNAAAVIVNTASIPSAETRDAENFCITRRIRYHIVNLDILSIEGFEENPVNRCYICKCHMCSLLKETAGKMGIDVIAEGSNIDDESDFRPGMRAVKENGIISPLVSNGYSKNEIRQMSKILGLETWNKPSLACLASRFVYGEKITKENLEMVEKAEDYIHSLGFEQVRVRVHGEKDYLARIEVTKNDIPHMFAENLNNDICNQLKMLGFTYVSVDIQGYRTGSMSETEKIQNKF